MLLIKGVDSSGSSTVTSAWIFVASAMVSGRGCPKVSGKNKNTSAPLTNAKVPKITIGSHEMYWDNPAMKGEMIPPILPEVEQPPTQAVRVEVGNNSATHSTFEIC